MNQPAGWAVLSLVLALGGCSEQKSAETAAQASPPAQEQAAERAPAPEAAAPAQPEAVPQTAAQEPAAAAPTPAPEPKVEAPRPAEAKTTPVATPAPAVAAAPAQAVQAAPQEPAPATPKAAAPKDVIVLTGSPLGGVRFEHKLHATRAGSNCETCHHPSGPEKLHEPMAQSGTCIDCHKSENAKGKKAPVNCMDCHKQENK